MNQRCNGRLLATCAALTICLLAAWNSVALAGERTDTINRYGSDVRYLASDELEGRGPGTAGLDKAARYIRTGFENVGIPGAGSDGAYERPFSISLGSHNVPSKTFLKLTGPGGQRVDLELGKQFQALSSGNPEKLELDLQFAGYGISAPRLDYDDYADAAMTGKAVVIIRREPQQDDEQSKFDGKRASRFSYVRAKLQAAQQSGAAAIILVNDPFTVEAEKADELSRPGGFGRTSVKLPFLQVTQTVVDEILKASPIERGDKQFQSLADIEADIDENLTPMSQPLDGWKAELQCVFESSDAQVSNVAAVIEGAGDLAEETIVIGAHYDHLGFGPYGSRRPASNAVHNGADDNASGTAAVMELARRYASRTTKPARRLVFIAFTAEERGLLGSNHYLQNPLFPLDQTVAMINFDMIGHLNDNGLTVGGTGSSPELATIVEKLCDGATFKVHTPSTTGGSDHAGFYRNNVPFLFFHTGVTDIYHTPDDDYETLDIDGAVTAIDFAERVVDELLSLPERPKFSRTQQQPRAGRATAYLGVVPDYAANQAAGVPCSQVSPDSPAAQAGIQTGDVITKIGDVEIQNVRELSGVCASTRPATR